MINMLSPCSYSNTNLAQDGLQDGGKWLSNQIRYIVRPLVGDGG